MSSCWIRRRRGADCGRWDSRRGIRVVLGLGWWWIVVGLGVIILGLGFVCGLD